MSNSPGSNSSGLKRWSFFRSHRLKRKRLIEPLFNRNNPSVRSVSSASIRIVYRFVTDPEIAPEITREASHGVSHDVLVEGSYQIGVAVGRSAGGAVQRNRVKRIIRESIRLNQDVLREISRSKDALLTAMVIFRGSGRDLALTSTDVENCLKKLRRELTE